MLTLQNVRDVVGRLASLLNSVPRPEAPQLCANLPSQVCVGLVGVDRDPRAGGYQSASS